jgi:hypothetical protein
MSLPYHMRLPGSTDGPPFTLQPPEVPQPKLLDEEITTHDWPMSPKGDKPPAPRKSLFWQVMEALN